MSSKKDFSKQLRDNDNTTGFHVSISCTEKGGPLNISFQARAIPGEPLTDISIENACEGQLVAICNALDKI